MRKLRRYAQPVATLLGVAGAAAAFNRGVRERSALPINHLGGVQRPWKWRGHDVFVTERGSGPPLVLVHGVCVGASSFEFRRIAALLERSHRIIALDLLGCGLSEMPNADYGADVFVDLIVDALALAGGPCTLVGSSLGGAFAICAAARTPHAVERLVTIAPTGLAGRLDGSPTAAQRALEALICAPLAGEALYNSLASRSAIARFLRDEVYAGASAVTTDVVDHYYAVAHQRGARYVPAAFVGGALNCNVARDLPFVESPLLVLWGERSPARNAVSNAADFARFARCANVITFARSGLLPHEEEPEGVAAAIEAFALSRGGAAADPK